jgi:hypothetical protein
LIPYIPSVEESSLVKAYQPLVNIVALPSEEITKMGILFFPTIVKLDINQKIKRISNQYEANMFKED